MLIRDSRQLQVTLSTVALVDIVIPAYRSAVTVSRALSSVMKQSEQDFSVWVIDDSGRGTSHQLATQRSIRPFLHDERVQYVPLSENGGAPRARNFGAAQGDAPYIAFLDADDEWLPRKLERQLILMADARQRLALVSACWQRVSARKTQRYCPRLWPGYGSFLEMNIVGPTSTFLVSRRVFESVGGFEPSLEARQDLDLALRMSREGKLGAATETLVRFHRVEGSLSDDCRRLLRAHEQFEVLHMDYLSRSAWRWARHVRRRADLMVLCPDVGPKDAVIQEYLRSLRSWPTIRALAKLVFVALR